MRRFISMFVLALGLGAAALPAPSFAQLAISGTIKQINPSKGLVTITRSAGNTTTGQGTPDMIRPYKVGDNVTLTMAGPRIMKIVKN